MWMPQETFDENFTWVQVRACCHPATSHYLSQYWRRFISPYGLTRPQWVKDTFQIRLALTYSDCIQTSRSNIRTNKYIHLPVLKFLKASCTTFTRKICSEHHIGHIIIIQDVTNVAGCLAGVTEHYRGNSAIHVTLHIRHHSSCRQNRKRNHFIGWVQRGHITVKSLI